MNPWTAILDPRSVMPKEQERGRRHILSDELDPSTLLVASKPGPKPPAATPEPTPRPADLLTPSLSWPGPTISAPIPRKAKPEPTPGPAAYRVPKPEAMSYPDAIRIRERARMRQPVAPYLLEEANKVVEETRRAAMPPGESYQ